MSRSMDVCTHISITPAGIWWAVFILDDWSTIKEIFSSSLSYLVCYVMFLPQFCYVQLFSAVLCLISFQVTSLPVFVIVISDCFHMCPITSCINVFLLQECIACVVMDRWNKVRKVSWIFNVLVHHQQLSLVYWCKHFYHSLCHH